MQRLTEEEFYKEKIIEMVKKIEDVEVLKKIFTVSKTHLKILKEKDQAN